MINGTGVTFQANDSIVGTGNGNFNTLKIADSTGASAAGAPAGVTVSGVQKMIVNATGSVGNAGAAAGSTVSGVAEVLTINPTIAASSAFTGVSIVVGGQTYTSGTYSSNNTTAAQLGAAVKSLVLLAFGDAVSLGSVDNTTGAFTVTSKATGTLLPAVTYSVTMGSGSGSVANTVSTAPVTAVATTALAQLETIAYGGSGNATDVYTVEVGGRSVQAYIGSDQAAAATATATQINAMYGSAIATANGKTVTVQGANGVVLPSISATVALGAITTNTPTSTTTVLSSAATAATAAVPAVVYDVSGFAGLNVFDTTSVGGDNVKVAATTAVTVHNSNGGGVTVDGGTLVDVTTAIGTATGTTTSAVSVSGKALTAVSVSGGTGATVNNKENSTTATDNAGSTLTTVSLTSVDGNSTVGGKALTNVTVAGATSAARTVTISNSTVNHALNLTLNNTGYTSADANAKTVITDVAATSLNVISNGVKNQVDLSNNTLATKLTVSGSAKLTADVSIASLAQIDGSAATGALILGTLNAATLNVATGAGDDTMTIAATAATTVRTGAGNDKVSLSSAIAAGSTIDLGAGDDSLLYVATGSVSTGASSTGQITRIDGGTGVDTLSATLVNNGNKALFSNFEVLALDLTSGTFDTTLVTGLTGLALVSAGGGTYTGVTTSESLTITNTAANSATTTLTMTGVSGTADSYAITFNAAAQTSVPSSANVLAATIAVAGIENFNIASNGGANTWNSITLGADNNANSVTVTGTQNLDLAFASGFGSTTSPLTGVASIDASALTGKLAVNLANVVPNATALVVKGGAAADTFTTTTAKATLTLGAGYDLVNAASSTITVSSVSSPTLAEATGSLPTITDIATGDTIKLASSATAATLGAATSTASATNLLDALNALANASAQTAWGVYGGNTYIVFDASGTTGTLATSDVVIALTGTVDLAASNINASGVLTVV